MVFLSNYLVFKIVLAALGRVDYPVAGDLELKYGSADKIFFSGGSYTKQFLGFNFSIVSVLKRKKHLNKKCVCVCVYVC